MKEYTCDGDASGNHSPVFNLNVKCYEMKQTVHFVKPFNMTNAVWPLKIVYMLPNRTFLHSLNVLPIYLTVLSRMELTMTMTCALNHISERC